MQTSSRRYPPGDPADENPCASSYLFFICAHSRASAPLRPAPGASEDGAAPNDPLAIDLRVALSPHAARAAP